MADANLQTYPPDTPFPCQTSGIITFNASQCPRQALASDVDLIRVASESEAFFTRKMKISLPTR